MTREEIEQMLAEGRQAQAMLVAVNTLREYLTCGDPRVEVQSARTILRLDHAFKEKQLLARVEALEAEIKHSRGFRPSLC